MSGPLDSFILDFILNNHAVEKDTSDLHLKGTLHSSPVFFFADEHLKIDSILILTMMLCKIDDNNNKTEKERLTWLRIPRQAGGMRQSRWIPQLFATLCAVCANQFAFSHNRKASSNGSPSFQLGNTFLSC